MAKKISGRLVTTIVSSLMEQAALAVIVFWGLPRINVHLPLWASIILCVCLMVGWGTWSVFTYRMGSRALRREPLVGLPNMLGTMGKVVSPLAPEGLVKIRGELWIAESESDEVPLGGKVIVVGQDRLKLVVRENDQTRI